MRIVRTAWAKVSPALVSNVSDQFWCMLSLRVPVDGVSERRDRNVVEP